MREGERSFDFTILVRFSAEATMLDTCIPTMRPLGESEKRAKGHVTSVPAMVDSWAQL